MKHLEYVNVFPSQQTVTKQQLYHFHELRLIPLRLSFPGYIIYISSNVFLEPNKSRPNLVDPKNPAAGPQKVKCHLQKPRIFRGELAVRLVSGRLPLNHEKKIIGLNPSKYEWNNHPKMKEGRGGGGFPWYSSTPVVSSNPRYLGGSMRVHAEVASHSCLPSPCWGAKGQARNWA